MVAQRGKDRSCACPQYHRGCSLPSLITSMIKTKLQLQTPMELKIRVKAECGLRQEHWLPVVTMLSEYGKVPSPIKIKCEGKEKDFPILRINYNLCSMYNYVSRVKKPQRGIYHVISVELVGELTNQKRFKNLNKSLAYIFKVFWNVNISTTNSRLECLKIIWLWVNT